MSTDQRARAERLLTDLIQLVATDGGYFNDTEKACAVAMAALADERRRGLENMCNSGDMWSFLRSVLSQGGAIQQDYQSGKYNDYEGYSARLDCAARERADQWIAQAIRAQADQEEA